MRTWNGRCFCGSLEETSSHSSREVILDGNPGELTGDLGAVSALGAEADLSTDGGGRQGARATHGDSLCRTSAEKKEEMGPLPIPRCPMWARCTSSQHLLFRPLQVGFQLIYVSETIKI